MGAATTVMINPGGLIGVSRTTICLQDPIAALSATARGVVAITMLSNYV
jgi:hypothetical protein